ncbi:MAG: DNA polymerase III subunit delta [Clostridia bacterium]|nr:DNA polymerase III subunit delta [Clostridia bacterium]MDD4047941.1 DNA polymerase III subunit delta [Clostridia bacterium]
MQYQSVMNSIKRGVISPIYLIYGEEEYLQEMIITDLKKALVSSDIGLFNLDEVDGEKVNITSIVDMANTLPAFAEKRLVIVKNAFFLSTSVKVAEKKNKSGEEERLLKYLADPLLSTCLVFWQKGRVDKRKKIYKEIVSAGQTLEIETLKGVDLNTWIVEEAKEMGKKLEPQAIEYMVINLGNKLRNIKSELEKLAIYSGENRNITFQMAKSLVTITTEGNIFNLVDKIGLRKYEEAFVELVNLLKVGEPPVKILFMIARQFRLILLAKDLSKRGYTEKQIALELKSHPFVVKKILKQGRNFSFYELEKSLQLLLESDIGIKTGMSPRVSLENLIYNLTTFKMVQFN